MKSARVKIWITIPEDLLDAVQRRLGDGMTRAGFFEAAIRAYLARLEKVDRDNTDLAILNANAERLNEEAADVLTYQCVP